MPKKPAARDAAKEAITEYLKSLHLKQSQGFSLDKIDEDRVCKKCNLVQAVYDLNEHKIIESNVAPDEEGTISISRATINKAIDMLEEEGIIEFKFGAYRYKPSDTELYDAYPILKVAPDISITPLKVDSLAFYRTSPQYSALVTDYINSQFSKDDICAVNLGEIIMCMDIHVPENAASVVKCFSLEERVMDTLKTFALEETKYFDDDMGYSESDVAKLNEHAVIRAAKHERRKAQKFGGQITNKPQRAIKKRKNEEN